MWKVSGKTDLPLASRTRSWDADAAEDRVRRWASGDDVDWSRYRQAFFAYDDENADAFGGYKLPFADVINGELTAVPRGVFACAGGRGVAAADLPDDVKVAIKRRIDGYYRRMATEFEDDTIRSPFEKQVGMRETKSFGEFKSFEGDRVVIGFASILGNVDDGGDLIMPGAYRKTLLERGDRLRWLWQHDMTLPPVAKILEIREAGRDELPEVVLAQHPEATGGLLVKREYLDTERGNEILANIRAGAITEMSIGYDALQVDYPADLVVAGKPCRRRLKEIRLWECSDVNWGMNAATANLKDMDSKALAQWLESRLHLNFTQICDDLFGDGLITRDERIALSGLIGDALDAFHAGMQAQVLAGVRERERWDHPETESSQQPGPEVGMAMRRRRVAVMTRSLSMVQ